MPGGFNVFLSYARVDSTLADPLVQALERAGVTVWRDTNQVDTFDTIRRAIDEGLGRSKVLLALYSRAYTERRACDWELAAAFIAGGPERILVLNPEESADHIQPQSLREQKFANPDDFRDYDALAAKIKARVAGIDGSFGRIPQPSADQKWFGLSPNGGAQTFVGRRAEIWQVHDGLAASSVLLAPTTAGTAPGKGSTLLRGLGGMGKTLLAEEYARRFAAAWPGGIFWLRAGGQLMDQYVMLAGELGTSFDPADPSSLKRAVTDAMTARPGAYLWVVDDLPHGLTADQARAWFAPTNHGRTLVTTRTRTLDDIAKPVELAELGEDEAYILLTLNRGPKDEAEAYAARAIVKELGRHALAVDLARHLVKWQGYRKVLADLRNPSKEALGLAAKLSVELPTGHDKSIAQTFLRSIQLLDANALDALRVAAHLAPHTPIPRELLATIRAHVDGLSDDEADDETVLALDQTVAHSLCELTDTGYVVHALVCRTMAVRYADEREAALRASAYQVLLSAMSQALDIRKHTHLTPLVAHASRLCHHSSTIDDAALANFIGRYYLAAGLYAIAEDSFLRSANLYIENLGPDDPETLTSLNDMAGAIRAQGHLDRSLAVNKKVLKVSRRALGIDNPRTLTSMNNIANILLVQNHFGAARKIYERVLKASGCELDDHADTLTTKSNLAMALRGLDRLSEAAALHEETLAARERTLGSAHADTLTSMHNLASTLWSIGNKRAAIDLQKKALDGRRTILGPDHPKTMISCAMLGQYVSLSGDLETGRRLLFEAAAVLLKKFGPRHPETQMVIEMLSIANALPNNAPNPD